MNVLGVYEKLQNELSTSPIATKLKNTSNLLTESKGSRHKFENDNYIIDKSTEIDGYWKITDKNSNESITINPANTSIQTSNSKNYLVSEDIRLGISDINSIDNDLLTSLKTFMNTDDVEIAPLNDSLVVRTDTKTGSIAYNRAAIPLAAGRVSNQSAKSSTKSQYQKCYIECLKCL